MRKHSWMVILGLAAGLLAAPAAFPQSPAPAPDAMAAARELVTTIQAGDQFKALLPIIMKNLKPAIVQGRPEVERDYDAIMPLLIAGMGSRVTEIIDEITALYARNFTPEELREVAAFYRGPTGQKIVQKLPVITQESMAIGQRFGQSIASELRGRMIDELRRRGHNI